MRELTSDMSFETAIVDIDWNEYELNLLTEKPDNPFMELLNLVWEEYSDYMKANNLVLPWFEVLGWS